MDTLLSNSNPNGQRTDSLLPSDARCAEVVTEVVQAQEHGRQGEEHKISDDDEHEYEELTRERDVGRIDGNETEPMLV